MTKERFENRNLLNHKGMVLVDKDSIVKIYRSKAMAEKTALKLNAKAVINHKYYIVVR